MLSHRIWCMLHPFIENTVMVFSVFILTEPNDESAANVDAAKTWREDRKKFEEIAGRTVRKSLGL